MKVKLCVLFFYLVISAESKGYSSRSVNASVLDITRCFSSEIQKNGYIMDFNDIKLPINAKEFSTYKMSQYSGSLWIESSTEGRPTRETGIINANSQSYNDLYNALLLCSEQLSSRS
ncbi:Uncharacterised protein [Escherichia coli]|uniref:hypothetical protein n=1 Tax=Escherichia coli TaxID=562 RepID=UPI001918211D|nr:hypothetical protein [Escherichia coli]CAD6171201.1 Uncharacterised protein [Escherichia coli]